MSTSILILILVISTVTCQKKARIIFNSDVLLENGDACVSVQHDVKLDGICMPIQDCPSILTNIISHKSDYTVCGFEGVSQIVCCPRAEEPVTTNARVKKVCLQSKFSQVAQVFHVAGGITVTPGEYSHMAALGYKINQEVEWKCGGSLISDQYVLTAAHCLTDRSVGSVQKVRLGTLNLLNDDNTDNCPEDFDVAKLIPHPDYNSKFVYNDIGLIELASQVHFNLHIRAICLPPSADIPLKYKSMGWGATGYADNSSVKLLKVDQELFSYEECQNLYTAGRRFPNGLMNETHICAGSRDSIQSTCQGDSGGPLLSERQKVLYIYGIVSFGSACGFANSPGVYTKVFPYVKWIEETIFRDMTATTQNDFYCKRSVARSPILHETAAIF